MEVQGWQGGGQDKERGFSGASINLKEGWLPEDQEEGRKAQQARREGEVETRYKLTCNDVGSNLEVRAYM